MSVLGHRVLRFEDPPLLTGSAAYVADVEIEGLLHAVFIRSSVAHGVLRSLDLSGAFDAPGVVAAFGARDLALPDIPEWPRPGGPPRPELARPCLARNRVRFVGEALGVVVAETLAEAVDASEQVIVEIDPLPVVLDVERARAADAPLLFEEHGSNVVLFADTPDAGTLDGAEVVVRAHFVNQRVAAAPLETNATLVVPVPGGGLDCVVSCQAPFAVREGIAAALGRPEESVRVRTVAVGGGFGAKGGVYPEQVVVAALAERLGRPVRHVETRSENLVAMSHGRAQVQNVALGARRDGTIVGLELTTISDVGAYVWRGVIPFRTSRLMATGPYRIPRLSHTSLGVVTNKTPIGPYRGAGRPEAATLLERAMDMLAATLGADPADVRRKNLLDPAAFPYTAPSGAVYDTGRYVNALDLALSTAGYGDLRKEQARRRSLASQNALGIGISSFVEISGAGSEYGSAGVDSEGNVTVTSGSSPHGQGLDTSLAQIASEVLGVDPEKVHVVRSDTALVARGTGTFGSRSGQLGGSAVSTAARAVLDEAKEVAARLLEASPSDIVASGGRLFVAGVPARALTWGEVASASPERGLFSDGDFAQAHGTYPFGTHIAVVEVDVETGGVTLLRMVGVDDCGTVVNPLIVDGQVHGGLAQGCAQALFEEVRYDELGNPITATLADYAMPSAAELPSFELEETVTPSPRNPLGMKGVGESGTVGGAVAVQNAVVDALAPFGVDHLDMPLTSERVWRAVRGGGR